MRTILLFQRMLSALSIARGQSQQGMSLEVYHYVSVCSLAEQTHEPANRAERIISIMWSDESPGNEHKIRIIYVTNGISHIPRNFKAPAIDNCGNVFAYAYNFSGSVTIDLFIDYSSPSVSSSSSYGSWFGSSSSGFFSGYGSSTEYISFQATTNISIYGNTYWYLSDGTSCSAAWSTYA